MKRHNYPKTVPQKRAAKAAARKRNTWMDDFAAFTRARGRTRLFR